MKDLFPVFGVIAALAIVMWYLDGSFGKQREGALVAGAVSASSSAGTALSGSGEYRQTSPPILNDATAFEARAEALAHMPHDAEREAALRVLALEWAAQVPTAAEHWASLLPDQAERQRTLDYIVSIMGESHPATAIQAAQRNHLASATIDSLAELWGERNFPAAAVWASDLPPGPGREETLSRVIIGFAQQEPAAAASQLVKRLPPGPVQEEAAMSVLYLWLRRDEPAAAAWVARFPEGAFRARAEAELKGFRSSQSTAAK